MSWLSFNRRCRSQRRRRRPSCCNVAVVSLSPPPVAAACSRIQRHTSSRHPTDVRKKIRRCLLGERKKSNVRILCLNYSDWFETKINLKKTYLARRKLWSETFSVTMIPIKGTGHSEKYTSFPVAWEIFSNAHVPDASHAPCLYQWM